MSNTQRFNFIFESILDVCIQSKARGGDGGNLLIILSNIALSTIDEDVLLYNLIGIRNRSRNRPYGTSSLQLCSEIMADLILASTPFSCLFPINVNSVQSQKYLYQPCLYLKKQPSHSTE